MELKAFLDIDENAAALTVVLMEFIILQLSSPPSTKYNVQLLRPSDSPRKLRR